MATLSQKSMLVYLSIGQPKLRVTDKQATSDLSASHGVDKQHGRVVKSLYSKEDYQPISDLINQARHHWHYKRTLPWLDGGQRILPSSMFMSYAEKMREFSAEFDRLVDAFINDYAKRLSNAKAKLNGLFNAADYPDPATLRERFRFEVSYSPVPVAGDFRMDGIGEAEKAILAAEVQKREVDAMKAANKELAQRVADIIGNISAVCSKDKPRIYDSLLSNAAELADLIPALNVGNDPKLNAAADAIKKKVLITGTDTLKESKQARSEVAAAADDIVKQMAGFF